MLSPESRYHWRWKASRCWRQRIVIWNTLLIITLSAVVATTLYAKLPSTPAAIDLSDPQSQEIIRILRGEEPQRGGRSASGLLGIQITQQALKRGLVGVAIIP